MSEPTALLCVGLRSRNIIGTIAPRLLREDGTVVVAASLPKDRRPTTLAERVTYLALTLGEGVFDAEVVTEPAGVEVPVVYPHPMPDLPDWAAAMLTRRGWTAPAARAR